ncbi:RHO protein GDP dissociation inhibitor [Ancylostoma caninum]|uniref:RHO protein GDP dissociation inhibitor n=1 Tax=Ancylostoma caninum TaxID=29170 RepID=A0A368GP71_ANCCA|nr:RHO protein GDP dissociation inhibitor [Ancylostoma caninum]
MLHTAALRLRRSFASRLLKDDESLAKYKATLLGSSPVDTVVDPTDPRIVIIKSITLLVPGRDDVKMELDNAGDLGDATFKLKEGCHYRLRFDFYVQREIVTGLKYIHKVSRHGVQVLKETFMVGSYAPKTELQSYTTPVEEAPSGMLHRGKYKVKSQMTDDDGHDWLTWSWTTEISKDW